jgi:hypothetical protein
MKIFHYHYYIQYCIVTPGHEIITSATAIFLHCLVVGSDIQEKTRVEHFGVLSTHLKIRCSNHKVLKQMVYLGNCIHEATCILTHQYPVTCLVL